LPQVISVKIFDILKTVDTEAEQIELRFAGDCSVEEISGKTPEDHPCYSFFLFKHTHEGDYLESIGKCY
jgi:hypothetical protein